MIVTSSSAVRDRHQSDPGFGGGYEQQQHSRGCADQRAGKALRGHHRGLVQAGFHRDNRRDRRPLGMGQVRAKGNRGGTRHAEGAQDREGDQRRGQFSRRGVTGKLRERLWPVLAPANQPPNERDGDPQRRPPRPTRAPEPRCER